MKCKVCGEKLKGRQKKFCSESCRGKYYYQQKKQCKKELARICLWCKEPYVATKINQKFCCHECKDKWDAENRFKNQPGRRPFTDMTVFLVHEYFVFGDTIKQISTDLRRPESEIVQALSMPLNSAERERIAENASIRLKRTVLPVDIK